MVIGVLGGTGQVGREVVRELERRGHEAIALSRKAPHGAGGGEHRAVDVATGEGLDAAVAGLDVVVDVLQGSEKVLVAGLERALAAARRAGARHVVSLSILGADRVPLGYYRTKMAQEAVVRESGVPWTIVRATQFHTMVAAIFAAGARFGVLPAPRVPLQPVDPGEVAVELADRVEAGPDDEVHLFAGPRVERVDELARAWARAKGVRRPAVPLPAVGPTLRAVRAGGLTDPSAARGDRTFADWLAHAR